MAEKSIQKEKWGEMKSEIGGKDWFIQYLAAWDSILNVIESL